jgi:hypothetical protein
VHAQELAKHDRADERGEHRVDAHEHAEEAGRDEAEGNQVGRVRHDGRQHPGRDGAAQRGRGQPALRSISLNDFTGRTFAVDSLTGTTNEELWSSAGGPSAARPVRGIEDWRTVIAAAQAVGISSEATAARHRRPGVVYRPVRDAPPVPVWLAWWTDSPPPNLDALLQLICEQYAQRPPRGH